MMTHRLHRASRILGIALLAALRPGVALAAEVPAGHPMQYGGMQIMAVYLQPVKMEPQMKGQDPAKTDIHLEADIHALAGNRNGFPQDAWIPYLRVHYVLTKKGTDWRAQGLLDPMVAADGPHYGANVRLDGSGPYALDFHIEPPSVNGFMRHTDKETGVAAWWAPFDYRGAFNFFGTGKKGGY